MMAALNSFQFIKVEHQDSITHVTLNRPEKHNALNEKMIEELTQILQALDDNEKTRVIIFRANGNNFCAGADLEWMHKSANYSPAENLQDAKKLVLLLKTLAEVSKPTIALVQGAVLGGGIGLVACCDIAIAAESANFSFSEVKIGLMPSTIAPYVIKCIGIRLAQYYFITAQTFDANQAMKMHLIHHVVPEEFLLEQGLEEAKKILCNGPKALASVKKLLQSFADYDDTLLAQTAQWIADMRASDEGKEGINAFLEKRKAKWITV